MGKFILKGVAITMGMVAGGAVIIMLLWSLFVFGKVSEMALKALGVL